MRKFIVTALIATFSLAAFANPTQQDINTLAAEQLLEAKNELVWIAHAGARINLGHILGEGYEVVTNSCYKNQEISAFVCSLTVAAEDSQLVIKYCVEVGYDGLPDGVIGTTVQVEQI